MIKRNGTSKKRKDKKREKTTSLKGKCVTVSYKKQFKRVTLQALTPQASPKSMEIDMDPRLRTGPFSCGQPAV